MVDGCVLCDVCCVCDVVRGWPIRKWRASAGGRKSEAKGDETEEIE